MLTKCNKGVAIGSVCFLYMYVFFPSDVHWKIYSSSASSLSAGLIFAKSSGQIGFTSYGTSFQRLYFSLALYGLTTTKLSMSMMGKGTFLYTPITPQHQ